MDQTLKDRLRENMTRETEAAARAFDTACETFPGASQWLVFAGQLLVNTLEALDTAQDEDDAEFSCGTLEVMMARVRARVPTMGITEEDRPLYTLMVKAEHHPLGEEAAKLRSAFGIVRRGR